MPRCVYTCRQCSAFVSLAMICKLVLRRGNMEIRAVASDSVRTRKSGQTCAADWG